MIDTDLKYQGDPHPWTINIHLIKKKRKAGGKNKSFLRVDTNGRGVDTRKGGMRVYTVDVFCNHI
jgi:hypothetical protein